MRRSLPTKLIAGAVAAWIASIARIGGGRSAGEGGRRFGVCPASLQEAAGAAPDYHALRLSARWNGSSKLIRNGFLAHLEWTLEIAYGSWRPIDLIRSPGYLGCGMVNVNRFGSDAGNRWFSAIVRDDGKVALAHIDQTGDWAQAKPYCARAGQRGRKHELDVAATSAQSAAVPRRSAVFRPCRIG